MRIKFVAVVALAALLLCALGGAALAAEPTPEPEDIMTTQAKIQFTEAIFFDDFPDGGGMDVDFGEQDLPLDVVTRIPAADGDHTLRVCERRVSGGKWSVSAIITPMTSGDENFNANLNLYSPTVTDGLAPILTGAEPNERVQVSIESSKAMEATGVLVPGDYDLTTIEAKTQLVIYPDQTPLIEPLVYTGTVTWTLTLEPAP